MDHFINIPIDQTGIIPDPKLASVVAEALQAPFDFSDVFFYSHGWWSTSSDSMASYTRFSVDFVRFLSTVPAAAIPLAPQSSFGIGVHWPSMLSDNELSNIFEPLTFYQMERRSDDVGFNAVFALLQILYMVRQSSSTGRNLKVTLLGHSFGCRVVCRALDRLYTEIMKASTNVSYRQFVLNTRINLVLLQAAFDTSDLEAGERYGNLQHLPRLRILITKSDLDLALKNLFPMAEHINILSHHPGTRQALGWAGPTATTAGDFGAQSLTLLPGFVPTTEALLPVGSRMLVSDITPVHQASSFPSGPLKGHHSDIFLPEIYKLIANFSFQ